MFLIWGWGILFTNVDLRMVLVRIGCEIIRFLLLLNAGVVLGLVTAILLMVFLGRG